MDSPSKPPEPTPLQPQDRQTVPNGDLTGKLVRWEFGGQWLTARVAGTGTTRDSLRGEVVDPGNYVGLNSDLFGPDPVQAGTWLPNLLRHLLTVIDETQPGDG